VPEVVPERQVRNFRQVRRRRYTERQAGHGNGVVHVLITGGSGFIGSALCRSLIADAQRVTVLTRNVARARPRLPPAVALSEDLDAVRDVDAIVNLAGENLAQRWTDARKREFVDSRIGTTRRLLGWIAAQPRRPRVLVSGSAIGWYGKRGDEALAEDAAPGDDFGARLCRDWEAAAAKAEALGVRVCVSRTGVVLDRDGGALKRMLLPFRLGLGGPIGAGMQWMSWIARSDLVALIRRLLADDAARGAWNATAPEPVTNAQFARALARCLHRPALLPTPAFALRLAFGEMADMLLTGQRVMPARALAAGFAFAQPRLDRALASLLG
jgi:uncharacterized protein (TIGR01777 family)